MTENNDISIYIHFSYCKSRCPYCDFFKKILPRNFDEAQYIKKYISDINFMKEQCGKRNIKSIFFGGGTPSILSEKSIEIILNEINKKFSIDKNVEISLEANPNTYDKNKFLNFKNVGINRLSLGVQALNENDLKVLGRTHSLKEAIDAIETGISLFDKFSIDLIYARPNQTFNTWQQEIDLALKFGLKHISLYQLTLEDGTIFAKKNIKMLDANKSLELYRLTSSYLNSYGLQRYEVSNFSKDGYNICKHNMVYWQGGNYWGIGEGAHGRIKLNEKIYAQYDGNILEALTPIERAEELIIMGLRIKKGINCNDFYNASSIKLFDFISQKKLNDLEKIKLLEFDDECIRLTEKGTEVLDSIILELCS